MSDTTPLNNREDAFDRDRLGVLLAGLVDGSLDEAGSREIAKILNGSQAAQEYYLRYIQTHCDISSHWGGEARPVLGLACAPVETADQKTIPGTLTAIGLLAPVGWVTLGVAASSLIAFFLLRDTSTVNVAPNDLGVLVTQDGSGNKLQSPFSDSLAPSNQEVQRPRSFFKASIDGSPGVAVVVAVDGDLASEFKVGDRFPPGVLKFDQGTLQLYFVSGANMVVEGPATLKIESEMLATLESGSAITRISKRARGFVLNSPGAAVVDLGTEFKVEVDKLGKSEVEVVDGSVNVSLIGDDGNTLTSRRVDGAQRVAIDTDAEDFLDVASSPSIQRVVLPKAVPLPIDDRYVNLVKQNSPLAYWRFESVSAEDTIANEMGDSLPMQIHRDEEDENAVQVAQGQVQFQRSPNPRYLASSNGLDGIVQSGYTLEMWMMPDDLDHATCLAIIPDWSRTGVEQLNLIEVVTDTFLVHLPGSIRGLYRCPPRQSHEQGRNLFSPGMVTPGQWHHVVMAVGEDSISLYLNGNKLRTIERTKIEIANDRFRCLLGQLTLTENLRQFSGLLDEVAVYTRPLSEDEITSHYQIVQQP